MGTPDAHTQLVGLIGWPVGHSRSPSMHNAAFAELGLNWAYLPLAVEPERVGDALRGLRALGLRGANVTVPHKQEVMRFLDELSPVAAAIGAVNTIVVAEDGRLLGENTDAAGFAADLAAHGVKVGGRECVVLGAGGSARSVVWALAAERAASISLVYRTRTRAEELVAALQPHCAEVPLALCHQTEFAGAELAEAALVVNCTPIGMTPHVDASPWEPPAGLPPGIVVYDLVYSPLRTRLLELAEAAGACAIGGIGMLVHQGALAFTLWTGQAAPLQVMRDAALKIAAGNSRKEDTE